MSETQQYGKRWNDLPADEQQEGYWLAIGDDHPDLWGLFEYEMVYVCPHLGQIVVWIVGDDKCEQVETWRFLRRMDLPKSAADVANAEQEIAQLTGKAD